MFVLTMLCCAYLKLFYKLSSAHDNIRTTYEVQFRGVDTPNDVNETFYGQATLRVGSALSQAISGLMPYSAYNVSVRATNQYGVGDFSEEVTVRTEEGGEYGWKMEVGVLYSFVKRRLLLQYV